MVSSRTFLGLRGRQIYPWDGSCSRDGRTTKQKCGEKEEKLGCCQWPWTREISTAR